MGIFEIEAEIGETFADVDDSRDGILISGRDVIDRGAIDQIGGVGRRSPFEEFCKRDLGFGLGRDDFRATILRVLLDGID